MTLPSRVGSGRKVGASLPTTPTLTLWHVYKIPETPHWINPHISFTETWSVGEERPYMGIAATGPQPQALKQAVAMEKSGSRPRSPI